MTTYFGFIPSESVNKKIDETIEIIENQPETPLYPIQLEIVNDLAHELLDNIFVYLVDIIENKKRQQRMIKIVASINSAVDIMLKHIITEQPNDVVMKSFNFLLDDCLFVDNDNHRRVGFKLSEEEANLIKKKFTEAKVSNEPCKLVQEAMTTIIQANLTHFMHKFTSHLELSTFKRKAIPVAEVAIAKASSIALNKLLPDMPLVANIRLIEHFEGFIIEVNQ